MKQKFLAVIIPVLIMAFAGYGQDDSMRTINDKPGTPQSLRTPDQSPQSHVNIINTNTAPGQTANYSTNGNSVTNNTIITNQNTGQSVSTNPVTNVNVPAGRTDSAVSNSAIRNGVSNVTNPIRNQ